MKTCYRRWGGVGVAVRVRRKSVLGALRIVLNKGEQTRSLTGCVRVRSRASQW
jgi:hypothetical protein